MRKQVNRLCKQRGNEMFPLLPTREWMFGNINSLRPIRYREEAGGGYVFLLVRADWSRGWNTKNEWNCRQVAWILCSLSANPGGISPKVSPTFKFSSEGTWLSFEIICYSCNVVRGETYNFKILKFVSRLNNTL